MDIKIQISETSVSPVAPQKTRQFLLSLGMMLRGFTTREAIALGPLLQAKLQDCYMQANLIETQWYGGPE